MARYLINKKRGFGLVEVIISIGIASIIALAINNLNARTSKISVANLYKLKGNLYAAGAVEAMRDLELSNYSYIDGLLGTCTEASPCHTSLSSGVWTLVPGSETTDGYTRSVWIDSVERDTCSFPSVISSGSVCTDASGNESTIQVFSKTEWTDPLGNSDAELSVYVYEN